MFLLNKAKFQLITVWFYIDMFTFRYYINILKLISLAEWESNYIGYCKIPYVLNIHVMTSRFNFSLIVIKTCAT